MQSRLTPLSEEQMSSEQKQVLNAILQGPRGNLDGPFLAWIHSPALADHAQQLGAFCRYKTRLPLRLSELAILVTAQAWQSQAEWQIHEPIALENGLDPVQIEAIRCNGTPQFNREDEQLVYEVSRVMYQSRRIPDALYQSAVDHFGEAAMVELIGILGYYSLVAMTLNAFHVRRESDKPLPFAEN